MAMDTMEGIRHAPGPAASHAQSGNDYDDPS
jgi:hypothetical protein